MRDKVINQVIESVGSNRKLADALGIDIRAIYQWVRIPQKRVLKIEQITGIPRHELRPDIYPNEAA